MHRQALFQDGKMGLSEVAYVTLGSNIPIYSRYVNEYSQVQDFGGVQCYPLIIEGTVFQMKLIRAFLDVFQTGL